jgi:hypothetical protein
MNSGLKIKWDTRWTRVWRSSEIHDELGSEDQVRYTMNSGLKIKWDTRWNRVWRSSEIHDELGSADQVRYTMNSDMKIKWDTGIRWTRVLNSSEIRYTMYSGLKIKWDTRWTRVWIFRPEISCISLDLQIRVHRLSHLIFRSEFIVYLTWSSEPSSLGS